MSPEEEAFIEIKKEVEKHRDFVKSKWPHDWSVIPQHELWFRGENKTYPETRSSIGRQLQNPSAIAQHKLYRMWIYSKTKKILYQRNPKLFSAFEEASSWNYPFFMQHYGVPTDFLDFTPSLKTALYFATTTSDTLTEQSPEDEWPVLWLFDPSTFNHLNRKRTGNSYQDNYLVGAGNDKHFYDLIVYGGLFDHQNKIISINHNANDISAESNWERGISVAISPHSDENIANPLLERMYKQTGYFLYSNNSIQDLHHLITHSFDRYYRRFDKVRDEWDTRLVKKIKIPPQQAQQIRIYLKKHGYNTKYYRLSKEFDVLNKNDFSYDVYEKETDGGYNRETNKLEFIKKYIASLEIWLN